MEQQTVHKSFKYKLMPTPKQEEALELVLSRCRTLYNCALEQRKTWWGRGQGISARTISRRRNCPTSRTAYPNTPRCIPRSCRMCCSDWIEAYPGFFRRIQAGRTAWLSRASRAANRYHSFTYPQYGNGSVSWMAESQPLQDWAYSAAAASSPGRHAQDRHHFREADGWYVCSLAPRCPSSLAYHRAEHRY